jgi:hypothetical protein
MGSIVVQVVESYACVMRVAGAGRVVRPLKGPRE